MLGRHLLRRCVVLSLMVLCLTAWSGLAAAQNGEKQIWEPTPWQEGKDVVWLPSEQALVDKMLGVAKLTPADYLIDLGSGDGRIVITAAKRGIRALGIEYNGNLVAVSKRNAERAGVADRAQFVQGDLFEKDFSQASVLTMFLLPSINLKLRPQILDMKPGTRIVSNTFDMGDWPADQRTEVTREEGCSSAYCEILSWVVPAKVGGVWKSSQGELSLQQTFQKVSGTFNNGGTATPIADGRVEGSRISFRVGEATYSGEVNGDTLQGTVTGPQGGQWLAKRAER